MTIGNGDDEGEKKRDAKEEMTPGATQELKLFNCYIV